MPIREYRCNECGFQFESIDLGADSDSKPERMSCPNCGSMEVGKRISLFFGGKNESACSNNNPRNSRRLG